MAHIATKVAGMSAFVLVMRYCRSCTNLINVCLRFASLKLMGSERLREHCAPLRLLYRLYASAPETTIYLLWNAMEDYLGPLSANWQHNYLSRRLTFVWGSTYSFSHLGLRTSLNVQQNGRDLQSRS